MKKPARTAVSQSPAQMSALDLWLTRISWGLAALMVALMAWLLVHHLGGTGSAAALSGEGDSTVALVGLPENLSIPAFDVPDFQPAVYRKASLRTIIPTRERDEITIYTVEQGDSIFGIAKSFDISPETVLWANYDVLNDDPHMIEIGLDLKIPPTNGVYYQVQEGDTIESVASKFKADPDDILTWPGNHLDIVEPVLEPGTYIMVPGGQREFRQWVVPTIARGRAGVNTTIIGPGSCDTSAGGAFGTGSFVWPAGNHYLSGNDYWSGHLAIDIAAGMGAPVYATDSGLVVYAGAIGGGYGNMVMIDHGNGFQSLYAHLSQINVRCGQSVYQGNMIGLAGSTGNSTGPHLHFEIRYFGAFVNPWQVLP